MQISDLTPYCLCELFREWISVKENCFLSVAVSNKTQRKILQNIWEIRFEKEITENVCKIFVRSKLLKIKYLKIVIIITNMSIQTQWELLERYHSLGGVVSCLDSDTTLLQFCSSTTDSIDVERYYWLYFWTVDSQNEYGICKALCNTQNNLDIMFVRGEIRNNKLNGYGAFVCSEYTFEGRFKDNNMVEGTKVTSSYTYTGSFENDLFSGYGVFISKNGHEIYSGHFKNGKFFGRGVLELLVHAHYAFKNVWDAEWKGDGQQSGNGILRLYDGTIYIGDFYKLKPYGEGTKKYPNGDVYIGEWVDGMCHGHGMHYYINGNLYTGMWLHGMRMGQGELKCKNGDYFMTTWLLDQPVIPN
jgi:hypothetical protein